MIDYPLTDKGLFPGIVPDGSKTITGEKTMLTGLPLILFFLVLVILMVWSIAKWKLHPFPAIMGAAFLLAVSALPLEKVPSCIGTGFGGTFTSLGLVIIAGTLIGSFLEYTGAALTMADTVIKTVGKKRPDLAMLLIGWIVSIPVFCDSGFVMLNPIRKALAKRSGISPVTLAIALSAGLYTAHVFIPPTPGPIAAAEYLGLGGRLLWIIAMGAAVSIPVLASGYFFARFMGKRVQEEKEEDAGEEIRELTLAPEGEKLPGIAASFLPILLPILLMAGGSITGMLKISGTFGKLLLFLGTPVTALSAGAVLAIVTLFTTGKKDKFYFLVNESLKTAGPILFITAGGGVLGKVIQEAGIVKYITANLPELSIMGIFFPFLLAALLKTAQGSSTVAITATAGILGVYSMEGSLMAALGLNTPISAVLTVMAIGAGAMTVSHANDSYFWVMTKFSSLSPQDGYRTQTLCTLVMGLTGIFFISILHFLFR